MTRNRDTLHATTTYTSASNFDTPIWLDPYTDTEWVPHYTVLSHKGGTHQVPS